MDALRRELGVASVDDLERACRDGRVAAVRGFGPATARKILDGIAFARAAGPAKPFPEAAALAVRLRDLLAGSGLAQRVEIAGDVRRGCELVAAVDLVAQTSSPGALLDFFESLPGSEGGPPGRGSARMRIFGGLRAELVAVPPPDFGTALVERTGSAGHVAALAARARDRNASVAGHPTEAALYRALGLPVIPPELREDSGEVDAAARRKLPRLIEPEDVRGLFHVHTTESDGSATLEEMVEGAVRAGFAYVAITDHSKIAGYAHGLSPARVEAQHAAIDRLRKRRPEIAIFKGTEADILPDGSIDFGDAFLARFDVVVASVHSRFDLPEKEQTRRLVRAVRNPRVTILGHPTGRLLARRDGARFSIPAVLDAAAESGCAVEINGSPRRLDLDWRWHRAAIERGIPLAIDPDAHSVGELDYWRYGVQIARKGWVEAAHVLNARPREDITEWLRARRAR